MRFNKTFCVIHKKLMDEILTYKLRYRKRYASEYFKEIAK